MRFFESEWLKHPKVWWLLFGSMTSMTLAIWMASRAVPTVVHGQTSVPRAGPGGVVTIDVLVTRDLSKHCSVSFSRRFIDANQVSTDLPPGYVTAEGLRQREQDNPGHLKVNVLVPSNAAPGLGRVKTENQYVCALNPTTYKLFLPIESVWGVDVMVTP